MATKEVQLPELGEGVTEGELIKWLVNVGDTVKPDQAVAEMMTDKATVEVPSPVAGQVKELKKKAGDVVEVGSTLLILETGAEKTSSAPGSTAPAIAAQQPAASLSANATPSASPASAASGMASASLATPKAGVGAGLEMIAPADLKVLATPATRRLAREMAVDINSLKGTGLNGRVTREDVLKASGTGAMAAGAPSFTASATGGGPTAASSQQMRAYIPQALPAQQGEERVQLRGIRKKIAENMQMAKHVVPHFTLMDEANVSSLVSLRDELKAAGEKAGVKITYLPFVMKALIATIREFPMFNASIDDAAQEIVYKKYFNVGFAADTPNGLVVPVIKQADGKSTLTLAREIGELAKKARDGKLALDEMRGATFTITNIGSVGGQYATPIINHPEVAIFGMYKIQEKPVIKRDSTGVATLDSIKTMNFTVTADHRLIDGAVAANFLRAFIKRIENPGVLMLDMM